MKKLSTILLLLFAFTLFPMNLVKAEDLSSRLSGKILLQVEDKGQAWYVDPVSKQRAFLGRPDDAFKIMRELGLGISDQNYWKFKGVAPTSLKGRILLRVESNGEAYYVNPSDLKMHYLGRPADAFSVMRTLGQGISNQNLAMVTINSKYKEISYSNQSSTQNQVPADSILCNGKYWTKCVTGQKFVCPSSGNAYCEKESSASADNALVCNGKTWTACPTGQKFVCPSSGNAYCEKEYTAGQLIEGQTNKTLVLDYINKFSFQILIERLVL